mmetsp:Transcript_18066/g.58379  ORF Transcript_18066/g.58379 Transcript_18066/m.58379 type:complete len:284 (-) Transcript_18066:479-1330(-)
MEVGAVGVPLYERSSREVLVVVDGEARRAEFVLEEDVRAVDVEDAAFEELGGEDALAVARFVGAAVEAVKAVLRLEEVVGDAAAGHIVRLAYGGRPRVDVVGVGHGVANFLVFCRGDARALVEDDIFLDDPVLVADDLTRVDEVAGSLLGEGRQRALVASVFFRSRCFRHIKEPARAEVRDDVPRQGVRLSEVPRLDFHQTRVVALEDDVRSHAGPQDDARHVAEGVEEINGILGEQSRLAGPRVVADEDAVESVQSGGHHSADAVVLAGDDIDDRRRHAVHQ